MSDYVKTVWETGDIITAEKLNKIEDGVAELYGQTPSPTPTHSETAEVGVLNGDEATVTFTGQFLVSGEPETTVEVESNGEATLIVVLTNGSATVGYSGNTGIPNVSGYIERDSDTLVITGDGTVEFGGR